MIPRPMEKITVQIFPLVALSVCVVSAADYTTYIGDAFTPQRRCFDY